MEFVWKMFKYKICFAVSKTKNFCCRHQKKTYIKFSNIEYYDKQFFHIDDLRNCMINIFGVRNFILDILGV